MMAKRTLLLGIVLVTAGMTLEVAEADAQRRTRSRSRAPTTQPANRLGPPLTVTNWSPREKAHPGMTIVIQGRGLDPKKVDVRLGQQKLRVLGGSSTRIEARVTSDHYTTGSPLIIGQFGRQPRTLTSNFKVLNRDAVFSGPSLWHERESANSSIFTRGRVSLRLHLFEFANQGTGTYSESVRLVRHVRTYGESCRGTFGAGERQVDEYDWRDHRPSRSIEWRRLPDGRVEIRGIGLASLPHHATASFSGRVLTLRYETFDAGKFPRPITLRDFECSSDLNIPTGYVPPVVGVPPRLVEWSLQRGDAS